MFANYLKIAWRSMQKHKLFSFINVAGLALSLSVCIIVMVQVKEDLSYDRFHPHGDRIYRVLSEVKEKRNNRQYTLASTPLPLQNELAQRSDIIEAAVCIYPALKGKVAAGDKALQINGAFADPSFFKVFGFKLSAGNAQTALAQANGIILSPETAVRFFGKANPVGKMLTFENKSIFQVTGVLQPTPKSHLQFDAYTSSFAIPQLEKDKLLPQQAQSWNTVNNGYTYVLLKKGITTKTFDAALSQTALIPQLRSGQGTIQFSSQRLSKITPGSDAIYNEIGKGTVWAKLLTIIGVAFILLVAACFNYTNLTVARALTRAKEVGIRKVAGANRLQIFAQYMVEAVLAALFALAIACLGLLQFKPGIQFTGPVLTAAVLFTVATGAMAGAFPAWILSAFKPVAVLKNVVTQKLFGNLSLRKGLMIFQFSLSLLIIIFLTTYYRQFSFLEKLDPGFYTKNILTVPISQKSDVFLTKAANISGVNAVARISETFGMRGSGALIVYLDKPVAVQQSGIATNFYFGDASLVAMHKLTLVAGSNFTDDQLFKKEQEILINERAAEVLGFKEAASAVGKTVWLNDSTQVAITGVLKNFYDMGAARTINPLVIRNKEGAFNYVNIQAGAAGGEEVVKGLAAVWNELNPHTPFEYEWLDKRIAAREDQSDAYATLGFLAFITITIAALGLLGLVVYTVETRRKEISIRKIVGASVSQLLLLLSKGFLKSLFIAGFIAMPLGYIASVFFLQNFANRVSIGWASLSVGFMFLLSIGLITILSGTYKAAAARPAHNLRTE